MTDDIISNVSFETYDETDDNLIDINEAIVNDEAFVVLLLSYMHTRQLCIKELQVCIQNLHKKLGSFHDMANICKVVIEHLQPDEEHIEAIKDLFAKLIKCYDN